MHRPQAMSCLVDAVVQFFTFLLGIGCSLQAFVWECFGYRSAGNLGESETNGMACFIACSLTALRYVYSSRGL